MDRWRLLSFMVCKGANLVCLGHRTYSSHFMVPCRYIGAYELCTAMHNLYWLSDLLLDTPKHTYWLQEGEHDLT